MTASCEEVVTEISSSKPLAVNNQSAGRARNRKAPCQTCNKTQSCFLRITFQMENSVSTCLASCLIWTTERMAMISLNTLNLLVLALTRWHPEELNLPIAERCCSNVLPIAGAVGPVLSCHLKSFLKMLRIHPAYHLTFPFLKSTSQNKYGSSATPQSCFQRGSAHA